MLSCSSHKAGCILLRFYGTDKEKIRHNSEVEKNVWFDFFFSFKDLLWAFGFRSFTDPNLLIAAVTVCLALSCQTVNLCARFV